MTVWILTGYKTRINAMIQIVVVLTMNILEFLIVPNLLLWGRLNVVFALMFIALIYYSEFKLNRSTK